MSSAPPDVFDRLRKIMGMFGSPHQGERDTALAMANRIREQHKLTWDEVNVGVAAAAGGGNQAFSTGAQQPPPPPPDEPDWQDADPVVIPRDIPTEQFDDRVLRACAERAVEEDRKGLYDLQGTDFLADVGPLEYWSPRQRAGLVRSLRRAWVIRKQAGLR